MDLHASLRVDLAKTSHWGTNVTYAREIHFMNSSTPEKKHKKNWCFAGFWQFLDLKNHGTFSFWMIFDCLWYAAMQIQHFRSELPVPACNLCKASKACTMQRPPTHVICRLTDRIEMENGETKHAKHGKNTASNIKSCTSMLLPDSILTCFFVAIWFRFGLVKNIMSQRQIKANALLIIARRFYIVDYCGIGVAFRSQELWKLKSSTTSSTRQGSNCRAPSPSPWKSAINSGSPASEKTSTTGWLCWHHIHCKKTLSDSCLVIRSHTFLPSVWEDNDRHETSRNTIWTIMDIMDTSWFCQSMFHATNQTRAFSRKTISFLRMAPCHLPAHQWHGVYVPSQERRANEMWGKCVWQISRFKNCWFPSLHDVCILYSLM